MIEDRYATALRTAAWSAAIVLVLVGVVAAIGRASFVSDWGSRAEPVRERALRSLGRTDPLVHRDPEEILTFDRSFRTHRAVTYLHVIPGAIFLALAPLQFSSRIRTRYSRLHRVMGRVLMICALITAAAGLFFGLFMPYGGFDEALAIAIVGGALFIAVSRGFFAIRSGNVAVHREWMLRAFALGLGISTVRVVAAALDLSGIEATPRQMFVVSIWSGWTLTLAVTEIWIRYTRARNRSMTAVPATA